ncbi:hypothetical protein D3C75_824090 [compost metagenome]
MKLDLVAIDINRFDLRIVGFIAVKIDLPVKHRRELKRPTNSCFWIGCQMRCAANAIDAHPQRLLGEVSEPSFLGGIVIIHWKVLDVDEILYDLPCLQSCLYRTHCNLTAKMEGNIEMTAKCKTAEGCCSKCCLNNPFPD